MIGLSLIAVWSRVVQNNKGLTHGRSYRTAPSQPARPRVAGHLQPTCMTRLRAPPPVLATVLHFQTCINAPIFNNQTTIEYKSE